MSSIHTGKSSDSASSSRTQPRRLNNLVTKAGRTYLSKADVSVPYPLPVDLAETHRQIMFGQLTCTVYDTPVLSKSLLEKPPLRVLELGCDTAWWSATYHQYLKDKGHDAKFVGMDIKHPSGVEESCWALGMDWTYIQHDINKIPWPIPDGSFDLVMARNITLALDGRRYSGVTREYVRVLAPGGTLELWEHDMTIRAMGPVARHQRGRDPRLHALGLYPVADNSAFRSAAADGRIAEYNRWVTAGLAELNFPTMPCSYMDAMFQGCLVEGSDDLEVVQSKRIAVPLSPEAMAWEQQGDATRALSANQSAIRRTALENFVGLVEAFGPILRAQSKKSQGEWDDWVNKAKKKWLQVGGLCSGECLELGAWSVRKKDTVSN